MNVKVIRAHLALLGAASMWGLMSPMGKAAMEAGITGLSLATMRMIGGAVCFWIASLFAPKEKVSSHDLMLLFFAGLLGIVCNQGCFTFGLSLTSPIDASIVTTTMPIVTMILAALFFERTCYTQEGYWYISRLNRCAYADFKQSGRIGRWRRQHFGRCIVHNGSGKFCLLSDYI